MFRSHSRPKELIIVFLGSLSPGSVMLKVHDLLGAALSDPAEAKGIHKCHRLCIAQMTCNLATNSPTGCNARPVVMGANRHTVTMTTVVFRLNACQYKGLWQHQ